MTPTDSIFHQALQDLLVELFDGPPGEMAFVLNGGDPGMIRQLQGIDAKTASSRPMPGSTTTAAHVDHLLYGITLLNRWSDGEENPWATADWAASWRRTTVDEAGWKDLIRRLREASDHWKRAFAARTDWEPITAAGAISSAAHTAYHLGAIRQILAAMGRNDTPGA